MSVPRDSWAFRGVSSEPYVVVHVLPSTSDGYHWISVVYGAKSLRANWETAARNVPVFLAKEVPWLDVGSLTWSAYPCARRDRRVNGFVLLRQQEREEQYGTSDEGFVYFIQGDGYELIKIGHALNVTERLAELQTGSPVRLRVLAAMPGSPEDERELHRRFRMFREHGEWFIAVPVLLEVVDAAALKLGRRTSIL